MKRIIISLSIIAAAAAIVIGATTSFFSDTETSTGNTFTAGSLDLTIDNTSYAIDYTIPNYPNPIGALVASAGTTWGLKDLINELFFNFVDLKPGDLGEDTVSLHVTNDAWACVTLDLTKNDDVTCTEPELGEDTNCNEPNGNPLDGDLAQELNFLFWVDDGDNVLEDDEREDILMGGPAIDVLGGKTYTLADKDENNIGGLVGDYLHATTTYFIGKAWCFGALTPDPVEPDDNSPTVDPGVDCDGSLVNNASQTDQVMGDIIFYAEQSRNNPNFQCVPPVVGETTLTVTKVVTNDNGGNAVINDFTLSIVGIGTVTSGVANPVGPGTYDVNEIGPSGYQATFSGDCDADGDVTIAAGENLTCTITNNDIAPNITLIKSVINGDGGLAVPADFNMTVNGTGVPSGTSIVVNANFANVIDEAAEPGYGFVSISGNPKCPAALGETATLDEGEAITCTITNDDIPPGTGG